MLENFADEMETIKLINISYEKIGANQVETETIIEIEALVTNRTTRVSTATGNVEFIDYLNVSYDTGELKEGDDLEIRGEKYNVAREPKKYSSHMECEVIRNV